MKLHYTTIFIAGLMLCISNAVVAQQSSKTKKNTGLGDPTVEIYTDYEGILLETDKIDIKFKANANDSLMYPEITFTYPFISNDMKSTFSLQPISAISTVTDNLTVPEIGYGYLRAAFMHPMTPEADFYLHSPLSKKSAVSIYLKHRSFWGKSQLYDQAPVTPRPIADEILSAHETSSAGVAMQRLFKYAAIDAKAEYKHQSLLYYGQDTLFLKENIDDEYTTKITDNSYVRKFMRQTFNIVKADVRIYSLDNINKIFTFGLQGYFDYLKESAHRFNNRAVNQRTAGINGFLNFRITPHHTFNVKLYAKTYNRDNLSKFSSGLLNVIPSYIYHEDIMKASAGLNIESIYNGHGLTYNFYPFLAFHFITCKGLFIPYLEVTGGSTLNNYEKIISENPYVLPGLDVSNTRTRIKGEAGVRGNFSTVFAYCLKASYSMIDSMYFFVNSTEPINDRGTINPSTALLSNFDVVYDNISKIAIGFELSAKHCNIDALFFANYIKYNMDMEESAWHKPAVEAGLQFRYKLKPLNFILDALYRGETPVLLPAAYAAHTTSTKAYTNLGLTVEYRITGKFSVFLQGKNLLNKPYQNYYLYYHPGITVGGGLSYSF